MITLIVLRYKKIYASTWSNGNSLDESERAQMARYPFNEITFNQDYSEQSTADKFDPPVFC